MTTDTIDKLKATNSRMGAFAKAAPDLMEGFAKVSKTTSAAGRFSAAQKELIAEAQIKSRRRVCRRRNCAGSMG